MRKYLYLAYDSFCVCVALVVALYLRHGFPLIQEGERGDVFQLLLATVLAALIVFSLLHIHTGIWRYTSATELSRIVLAVLLVVLLSNSGLFLVSRLEMMPRSVPPMHLALAVALMGGSRLIARRFLGGWRAKADGVRGNVLKQHVLVVGANSTAELYLQFTEAMQGKPVVVEGFLDSDKALKNWTFQTHKILGQPEDLPAVLEQYNLHGIHITHIILAQLLEELPPPARTLLENLEQKGAITLVHFGKNIGPQLQPKTKREMDNYYHQTSALLRSNYQAPKGVYPYVKRLLDIVLGLALLVLLLPVMALTALLVLVDVGLPLLFWQQRPGLFGKPFRLYKFRTMVARGRKLDEERLAHKSGNAERMSFIGRWIRRLRLDELPQLLHIIAGTMSLVGPRPLLPDDQPKGGEQRLSVRPGATGWAQVHGGDALTPEEKLKLDLWYIRHMSFWLDVRIIARTLWVVLREDRAALPQDVHYA